MVIRYVVKGFIVGLAILLISCNTDKKDIIDPAKVHETNPSGTVKHKTGDLPQN